MCPILTHILVMLFKKGKEAVAKKKTKTEMIELIFGDFKYDDILPFCRTNYTVAILNGKAGLIDLNGNPLTEFIYDDLREYCEDEEECCCIWYAIMEKYCKMRLNGKWGILDDKGNIVYDFIYDNKIELMDCEEYVYLEIDGKTKVLDKDLKPVLKDTYTEICETGWDTFLVQDNGKYRYINKDGKALFDFICEDATPFNEYGLARVKINDKWGAINKMGEFVQECAYDCIDDYGDKILAYKDKQIFYLDNTGYIKSVGNFDRFDSFHYGEWNSFAPFIIVEKQGKYGVTDELGNIMVKTFYDGIGIFDDRILYILNNKYGLLDFNGRLVTLPEYNYISSPPSENDYCIAAKNGKYGVIDLDGQKIIDFKYEDMKMFLINDNYFAAKKKKKNCGIINIKGEVILDFIYDEIEGGDSQDFESSFFIAKLNGKSALFNEEGVRIA